MAVLTEPDNAAKHFKPSQFVLTELTRVVSDKWLKVKDSVRTKVFWMVKELIRNQVVSIDGVTWTLMRQVTGG